MAKVQNIPGLFGGEGVRTTTKQAGTAEELARIFGLAPSPSALRNVLSPSDRLGMAAAQQLGGPSIFEQMGIAGRAQELTQPTQLPTGFGGRTESENALLQEIMGLTGGGTAARGLGAPTQGALGSQLAPALMQLRQQDIQNILSQGQLGVQQLGALTGAAGVGGQERLGGIQGILDLAGLSMPTPVVQQKKSGGGFLSGLGDLAGGIGGLVTAFCHVAEELFGVNDMRTHFARFYCAVNDNQFIRTYRKMSRIWAKHLKDNPDKKHIVKPIWEAMAMEGYKEYKRWQDGLHQ